ncbi:MAG TPA: EAL domain-containing protein, partial [Anaerolineales bacterium]|nr:EAL domain-containing protein [Anaerolineales bacterium]
PGRAFTEEDVELLTRFGHLASIALENARLHHLLQEELTARIEAEADVLQFRKLLDQSNDAIYVIDPETACYVDFNAKAYDSLQYTRDELRQLRVMDVATRVSDLERWKRSAELVHSRSDGLIFETSCRRKDGTIFPVEVSACMLEYDGKNYMLAVVRDITERRQAAEELGRLNAELEDRVRERTADLLTEINERQRIATALHESEERYALAVRGANDGLWDWDLRTNKIYYSPRWKSMLGYKEEQVEDTLDEWFQRVHVQDLAQVQSALAFHLDGEAAHFEIEYRILHASSSYHWMLCRGLAVRDENGTAYRMAGSQTDITDRKQAEERMAHDAMHDVLTGLPNRTLFMDRLNQRLEHSKRHKDDLFAVLFIDLDRFKVINDSLGHAVGDKFLIATAHRLQSCLRPEDTISRLGGDEFAVLLNDIESAGDAIRVAERIQTQLLSTTMLATVERSSTASIGITMYNVHYVSSQEMLRDADTAMYRAKALGGGRNQIFDSAMYASALATLQLETDLKHAVENQEWQVYYQPIVSLASGAITGAEALIRWRHPHRGIVSPLDFITIAEETGDILSIGEYVLRTACRQVKAWRDNAHPGLWVSVNISGRQFQDQNLLKMIKQVLLETGLPPDGLRLEVTESVAMRDLAHSIRVLQDLDSMKVQVSLDDFGNGYSSLGYLKSFPLKILKIDRSFIKDIEVDKNSEAITTAIISMAHTLNLEVIAEGVEKEEQLSFLKAQFCDKVQGFLLSPPLVAEELGRMMSNQPTVKFSRGSQVFDRRQMSTRLRSN